jgi:hypothetical protein
MAVTVTPRNVLATFGYSWIELARILEEKRVPIGEIKGVPFAFVSDVVAALDGARAQPWTAEDTRAAIRRAVAGGARQ